MGTTTNYSFPFPELPDAPNVPGDMEALADAIDTALFTFNPDAIAETLLNAKGDLVVASSNDNAARLAVGTNGQVLTADSAQTLGVKWATPNDAVGASGSTTHLTATSFTDLTSTAAVTVTVGPSGKLLVLVNGFLSFNTTFTLADLGVRLSGANTRAAANILEFYDSGAATFFGEGAGHELITGLTPGSTTVTAQGRVNSSSDVTYIVDLTVVAL